MSTTPRVLVVGAGPVGLAMACELHRHGLRCRIVDQNEAASDKSKALGVHARTLEAFSTMGIADRAVAAGQKLHGTNVYADGKRIVHVDFDDIDSPFPFVLALPQDQTERILAERLTELEGRVERRTRLVALAQDDAGVTAALESEGGKEERVKVAWLVGCDGAHSTVRKLLGLSFEGVKYDEAFVLADLEAAWDLPTDEAHAFLAPDGVAACFPMRGGRFRVVADAALEEPTIEDVLEILRRRGAPPPKLGAVRWVAAFRIHRRIVPSYRVSRVFVAGDAAHIHSPIGGQGMNTGIQDAFNLAWKLALVDSGAARPGLLDSYDAERRPVAAATLTGTDLATKVVTLRNPVAREIRNRLAPLLSSLEVVQSRMLANASEVAVGYRKSPIVGEVRTSLGDARVGRRTDEGPSLSDWLDFGAAPRAGDRAPDVTLDDGSTLFGRLRHRGHTLLLFDGAAATPEGYANLASIAGQVRGRFGDHVVVHVVVPRAARPVELDSEANVVLDASGALHRRFGAGSECLYLVRPDGYVGFRSQPADGAALAVHLGRIFV